MKDCICNLPGHVSQPMLEIFSFVVTIAGLSRNVMRYFPKTDILTCVDDMCYVNISFENIIAELS